MTDRICQRLMEWMEKEAGRQRDGENQDLMNTYGAVGMENPAKRKDDLRDQGRKRKKWKCMPVEEGWGTKPTEEGSPNGTEPEPDGTEPEEEGANGTIQVPVPEEGRLRQMSLRTMLTSYGTRLPKPVPWGATPGTSKEDGLSPTQPQLVSQVEKLGTSSEHLAEELDTGVKVKDNTFAPRIILQTLRYSGSVNQLSIEWDNTRLRILPIEWKTDTYDTIVNTTLMPSSDSKGKLRKTCSVAVSAVPPSRLKITSTDIKTTTGAMSAVSPKEQKMTSTHTKTTTVGVPAVSQNKLKATSTGLKTTTGAMFAVLPEVLKMTLADTDNHRSNECNKCEHSHRGTAGPEMLLKE